MALPGAVRRRRLAAARKKKNAAIARAAAAKKASILNPSTRAELRDIVTKEVDFEIGEAVSPLERAAGRYGSEKSRAMGDIGALYGQLQPYVTGMAERLGQYSEQSRVDEEKIYAAAKQRLGALQQSRAAEAQGLAQTLGAPIPVEGFTAPVEGATEELEGSSAAAQLASIGGSQADVAAAEAFAGRVFPLQRAQTEKETSFAYDEAITQVQQEIDHIKTQRGTLIDKNFADRLIAEREFALRKLQADRDFGVAKQTLGLQKGELTGKYKGKPTLAARQLSQQDRQFQQDLSEQRRQFNISASQQQQALQQQAAQGGGRAAVRTEQRANAFALAVALTSPSDPKTYSVSDWVPVGQGTAGAIEDPPGSGKWFKYQTVKKRVPSTVIKGPYALFKALLSNGIPRNIALSVTRTRFGYKKWVPNAPPGGGKSTKKGDFPH
jgi:hypothetical protein